LLGGPIARCVNNGFAQNARVEAEVGLGYTAKWTSTDAGSSTSSEWYEETLGSVSHTEQ